MCATAPFRCNTCAKDPDNCLSDKLIRETTTALVEGGFKEAGYTIVWIDGERGPIGLQ